MGEFLARFQPVEMIVLVAVVALAIVGLAWLVVWRNVRLRQVQAALKEEALRKGLSVAEIQKLLLPSVSPYFIPERPNSDADAVGTITRMLIQAEASGPELEQYLAIVQAMDSATKQLVAEAFNGMDSAEKDQLLGIIRGLNVVASRKDDRTQIVTEGQKAPQAR